MASLAVHPESPSGFRRASSNSEWLYFLRKIISLRATDAEASASRLLFTYSSPETLDSQRSNKVCTVGQRSLTKLFFSQENQLTSSLTWWIKKSFFPRPITVFRLWDQSEQLTLLHDKAQNQKDSRRRGFFRIKTCMQWLRIFWVLFASTFICSMQKNDLIFNALKSHLITEKRTLRTSLQWHYLPLEVFLKARLSWHSYSYLT